MPAELRWWSPRMACQSGREVTNPAASTLYWVISIYCTKPPPQRWFWVFAISKVEVFRSWSIYHPTNMQMEHHQSVCSQGRSCEWKHPDELERDTQSCMLHICFDGLACLFWWYSSIFHLNKNIITCNMHVLHVIIFSGNTVFCS